MGLLEAMGILQRAFQTKAIEFCAYGSGTGLRRLRATEVAKLTLRDNRRVYDLVLESGLLSKQRIDEILQSGILTSPRMPPPHN